MFKKLLGACVGLAMMGMTGASPEGCVGRIQAQFETYQVHHGLDA